MIEIIEIIRTFELKVIGEDLKNITGVTSINKQQQNGLTWVKNETYLDAVEKGAVLIHKSLYKKAKKGVTFLVTDKNPKLVFSLIIEKYFTPPASFYLENDVQEHLKNSNIIIGDGAFIGRNVKIGKGTVIYPNVVIEANSIIGENCVLKSNSSVGTEGLGITLNPETNLLQKFPQIGIAILEDHVEVGPSSTIRRGTLNKTIIKRGTKIGSLVNIGHNCEIGENCIITTGAVLSGSVKMGDCVFVGVNSSIKNGVEIGSDAEVGMGAVVVRNVPSHAIVYGNPAMVKAKNE